MKNSSKFPEVLVFENDYRNVEIIAEALNEFRIAVVQNLDQISEILMLAKNGIFIINENFFEIGSYTEHNLKSVCFQSFASIIYGVETNKKTNINYLELPLNRQEIKAKVETFSILKEYLYAADSSVDNRDYHKNVLEKVSGIKHQVKQTHELFLQKQAFYRISSHHIHTPINNLQILNLLLDEETDSDKIKYLKSLEQTHLQLERNAKKFDLFNKLITNKFVSNPGSIKLKEAIIKTIAKLDIVNRPSFTLDFQNDDCNIYFDPFLLHVTLYETITNAAMYSLPGSTINIWAHPKNNRCICFVSNEFDTEIHPISRSLKHGQFIGDFLTGSQTGFSLHLIKQIMSFAEISWEIKLGKSNENKNKLTVIIKFPSYDKYS